MEENEIFFMANPRNIIKKNKKRVNFMKDNVFQDKSHDRYCVYFYLIHRFPSGAEYVALRFVYLREIYIRCQNERLTAAFSARRAPYTQ